MGSDFTHTIVNLSISQLPVAVRKSTEPDQGEGASNTCVCTRRPLYGRFEKLNVLWPGTTNNNGPLNSMIVGPDFMGKPPDFT